MATVYLKKRISEGGAAGFSKDFPPTLYHVFAATINTLNALVTNVNALGAVVDANKALYDAHTHESPGTGYAQSRGSTPDTGAAENGLTASEASAFTAAPADATSTVGVE